MRASKKKERLWRLESLSLLPTTAATVLREWKVYAQQDVCVAAIETKRRRRVEQGEDFSGGILFEIFHMV
jgi:hypothetical protein